MSTGRKQKGKSRFLGSKCGKISGIPREKKNELNARFYASEFLEGFVCLFACLFSRQSYSV